MYFFQQYGNELTALQLGSRVVFHLRVGPWRVQNAGPRSLHLASFECQSQSRSSTHVRLTLALERGEVYIAKAATLRNPPAANAEAEDIVAAELQRCLGARKAS